MVRTLNQNCETRNIWAAPDADFKFPKLAVTAAKEDFLHEGRKAALRAGFDGLLARGVTVVVATKVSGGIYANDFRTVYGPEFNTEYVQAVLNEKVNGVPRGNYFHRVILAHLDKVINCDRVSDQPINRRSNHEWATHPGHLRCPAP